MADKLELPVGLQLSQVGRQLAVEPAGNRSIITDCNFPGAGRISLSGDSGEVLVIGRVSHKCDVRGMRKGFFLQQAGTDQR